MASPLLGGLAPRAFLRDHWQKRPLLVRQALPGFTGLLERDALLDLATRGDAVSRLVIDHGARRGRGRWERHDGPFLDLNPAMLPAASWTLLVHGLESLIPGGWELLRRFSFIPAARVDDLMVSYAAPGGSVGPHDDAYDVFLLQGAGRRRWQIATRGDRAVDPRARIKVLARFEPEEEWLLEPGDMLYLPPGVAHWGIADGPCFTYSIGFLAPSRETLVREFLGYLGHVLDPGPGLYEDPDLRAPRDPLELGDVMVARVAQVLDGIRWDRARVADFLGRFLTMPRAHATFTPPARPLSEVAFARRLRGRGALVLALPSRGLVRRGRLFLDGESHPAPPPTRRLFARLVAERALPLPLRPDAATTTLLHGWYAAGRLTFAAR
jgi:50S ribosomal protein L16 3-hydroxylase